MWPEYSSTTAHVDVCNTVCTNYPDKCAISVLHNVEGFLRVEGNSWLLHAEDLKMFSSSAKYLWSRFLPIRSWLILLVFTQKNLSEHSLGLFWVFGGCASLLLELAFPCSSSISLVLRWCKNVPGEQARFRSHACPNSQVTKLFLECIKFLVEEGKKQLILLSIQCVMNKRQAEMEDFYIEGRNRVC